jgi:hypothetical protein
MLFLYIFYNKKYEFFYIETPPKYDYIFLIISCKSTETKSNENKYDEMKNLSRKYYEKMNNTYNYKYFYIEYNENIEEDILEDKDHIYIKGEEKFEKIYEKTIKSIGYINKKYDYKHVIRTNLSSYWNIHNLFEKQYFQSNNCYSGYLSLFENKIHFISGTGIVLSKDVAEYLVDQYVEDYQTPDDVLIAIQLRDKYFLDAINLSNIYWIGYENENNINNVELVENYINNIQNIENILYFRTKNADRNVDVKIFQVLNKKIYQISE